MGNASNKLPAVSILSCHQDGSLEAFQDDVTNVYKCLGRNKRSMECSNNSATPWPKPRSHAQCAAMAAGTADHKHKPRKIVSSVCGRRYRCYRLLQVFIASKEVADSKVSRRGSKSWDKKNAASCSIPTWDKRTNMSHLGVWESLLLQSPDLRSGKKK